MFYKKKITVSSNLLLLQFLKNYFLIIFWDTAFPFTVAVTTYIPLAKEETSKEVFSVTDAVLTTCPLMFKIWMSAFELKIIELK